MNFRRYSETDLEAVVDLFTESIHGLAVGHYDATQRAAWAPASPDLTEWKERLKGLQTVVADDNGALAGFIAYGENGHIDLLFTSPQHARKGVASSLYQHVESALSRAGVDELFTEASLVARPFFERQGFHVTEEQSVSRGGVVLRRFLMRKRRRAEPSLEMIQRYEQRTKGHIARVASNLMLLAKLADYGEEVIERARVHDASKFGPEERIPYVWLTEFHRCRRSGEPFEYPEGMEEQVKAAVHHHVTSNRHHSEFHSDPNDMTEVDLMEMVCDWTAMSQEFAQDGGSARGWADKIIGKRIKFNAANTQFVYRMIAELDQQIAAARPGSSA